MTLSGLSLSKTTPLRTNLPHRPPENVQRVSAFLMPITNLTFGRIHTVNLIRFHHLRFPSSRNFAALKSPMAEEANLKSTVESTMDNKITVDSTKNNKTESEKKQEESKVTIPPPPEKPLPDDCCGSGCVRCVWDMYYEELEEYNKLYQSNPDVKPS
ncbi:hypothetical protein KY290_015072 [Solanum tuberosum]|uniref:Oxidoreductase-like domain-containing protein n=1 Tax=Solanum tuberosum TaxID=4113 RepID=A0ABQ7VSP5_SOLTU|nr:hypothetical protein KY285_014461 [Solanum tuberosum]KAH0771091.1 hypothetical protein KY290_015072 [Solanum tuberosum]